MDKTFDYALILGSTPELSLAEIQAVVSAQFVVTDFKTVALLHVPKALDTAALMKRLGGTVKIVELTQTHKKLDQIDIPELAKLIPDNGGRAIFGVTTYQAERVINERQLQTWSKRWGLELKQHFKAQGRGARLVTNQDGTPLSAVTIDREKLLTKGREIVLVTQQHHVHAGVTVAVQPYEEFGERDFGRPGRSMKIGMLPPKVARMMVNLARPEKQDRILDPFVGTGTVLQEAALMGFTHLEGNDIDPKALDLTRQNFAWFKLAQPKLLQYKAEKLTHHVKSGIYDRIIFEGYLGPISSQHIKKKSTEIFDQLVELYSNSLHEFFALLKPGGRVVGAFPAWREAQHGHLHFLPMKELAEQAGFTLEVGPILYGRSDAVVLRQIWVLRK